MSRVLIEDAVVNGDFVSPDVGMHNFEHYASIEFFTDDTYSTIVDKATMTGTVTVKASEQGKEYGEMFDGVIALGTSDYDRPNAAGSYLNATVTLDSVAGASHFQVTIASK